ncbi:MAG: deoxyribose-phosphate aldolase [Caldilineaceae bacterium]
MTNHQLEQLVEAAIAAESAAASAAGGQSAAWTPPHVSEPATLARLIDHTLLKPEAGEEQIRALCGEAATWGFASICVHPTWVPLCTELLSESQANGKLPGVTKVCTVIGFPLGATLPAVKAYEVEQVAQLGAQEVDMVLNVGRLRDGDFWAVYRDILAVVDAARDNGLLLKVIIETGLLNTEQKIAACVIAKEAGADFVKTSTGFSGGGATVEDIALMRRVVGPHMGVKASGGVRGMADALQMVAAGATRIGTSSGVRIVQEFAGQAAGTASAPQAVAGGASEGKY